MGGTGLTSGEEATGVDGGLSSACLVVSDSLRGAVGNGCGLVIFSLFPVEN